jgi:hypothetical protein
VPRVTVPQVLRPLALRVMAPRVLRPPALGVSQAHRPVLREAAPLSPREQAVVSGAQPVDPLAEVERLPKAAAVVAVLGDAVEAGAVVESATDGTLA